MSTVEQAKLESSVAKKPSVTMTIYFQTVTDPSGRVHHPASWKPEGGAVPLADLIAAATILQDDAIEKLKRNCYEVVGRKTEVPGVQFIFNPDPANESRKFHYIIYGKIHLHDLLYALEAMKAQYVLDVLMRSEAARMQAAAKGLVTPDGRPLMPSGGPSPRVNLGNGDNGEQP